MNVFHMSKPLELLLGVFGDMAMVVDDLPISTTRKLIMCFFCYPREIYLAIKEDIRHNKWIEQDSINSISVFAEMRERNKLYTEEDVLRANLENLKKQRCGRYDL